METETAGAQEQLKPTIVEMLPVEVKLAKQQAKESDSLISELERSLYRFFK